MQSSNNSKIVFHENVLVDWSWGDEWCHTNGNAKKAGIPILISEKKTLKQGYTKDRWSII